MTVPRISISLPTIYERCAARTLRNIRDATRGTYEVVLVSPFPPPDDLKDNVVWIEEKVGTGGGCNAGHAAAWPYMRGEYAMAWVDDHFIVDCWDVLAVAGYERRAPKDGLFALGLRHIFPHHCGTLFGMYYPYFPLLRREHVEQVGWYDNRYKKGFADSDLALRIWSAGGRCEWADQAIVVAHLADDNRKEGVMFDQSDMDLAIERWAPKYGKGWDTSHLRGFNMDIEPGQFPQMCSGNTIMRNDPKFRDELVAGGWRVY